MARTLELFDETGDSPVATGDTATLTDNGLLSYQGEGVKQILSTWLKDEDPKDVFDNMRGWSNGYVSLKERT